MEKNEVIKFRRKIIKRIGLTTTEIETREK